MGDWTRHPFKHRDEPLVTIPIVVAFFSTNCNLLCFLHLIIQSRLFCIFAPWKNDETKPYILPYQGSAPTREIRGDVCPRHIVRLPVLGGHPQGLHQALLCRERACGQQDWCGHGFRKLVPVELGGLSGIISIFEQPRMAGILDHGGRFSRQV